MFTQQAEEVRMKYVSLKYLRTVYVRVFLLCCVFKGRYMPTPFKESYKPSK
jgi:hypothetical protein